MNGDSYIKAHELQRRDASEVVDEFADELSSMHGTCIDIGCGPGNITCDIILPKLSKDADIVGADISHTIIEKAQKNYQHEKKLSFVQLDIEADTLPITEINKYDHAISFYCLHWCQDIRHTFENIYKLLRPGGHALVMFLSYNSGFDAYMSLQKHPRFKVYMEDVMKYIPPFHHCPNPRVTLKQILEEVGFEVLHCSNREKSFIYESIQILQQHIIAVNPFLHKIPDNLKDEYVKELTREIARHKILFKNKKKKSRGYSILDRYALLIAYFRKPEKDTNQLYNQVL